MAVIYFNPKSFLSHFKPRKSRVKITVVIYRGIFITLATGKGKRCLKSVPRLRMNEELHGTQIIIKRDDRIF
jgi:hypothetical protein